ncbi:MAG TPA: choice-of-anchor tandem repeat GloVer-containing protein, partial [Thermoanaerobaculia bacterium]|nr:choice-of-anchor tandem repeat GloVer-containing protein [Thermoanaerobaculia bacterium]
MKTSTTGFSLREARAFRRELVIAVLVGFFGAVAVMAQTLTTYEIVHAFRNSGQPTYLIRASDGNLYGTTCWGGTHGAGSIFRIDLANNLTTLHSFGPRAGGWAPYITLMQATGGDFYGTTLTGGEDTYGTVFKMNSSGDFVTLHSFSGLPDGALPIGALIQASDGNLYGTTSSGGTHGGGTVFKMDVSGTLTTLHSFDQYIDGASPQGAL